MSSPQIERKLAALVFIASMLSNYLYGSNENRLGHNLLIKYSINDTWSLISRSNATSIGSFKNIYLYYYGCGIVYKLNAKASLRLAFRHFEFCPKKICLSENRIMPEYYINLPSKNWRFTSRTRLEIRFFNDNKDNSQRFRQEFTLQFPFLFPIFNNKCFIEEESFISMNDTKLENNWVTVGLSKMITKGIKIKLGYRWDYYRVGAKWNNRNSVVTGLNLFFT